MRLQVESQVPHRKTYPSDVSEGEWAFVALDPAMRLFSPCGSACGGRSDARARAPRGRVGGESRGWNLAHPRQREPARGAELVHRRPSRCRSPACGRWISQARSRSSIDLRRASRGWREQRRQYPSRRCPTPPCSDPLSRAMVDSAVSRGARPSSGRSPRPQAASTTDRRSRSAPVASATRAVETTLRAHEAGRLGPLLLTAGNAWASRVAPISCAGHSGSS